MARPYDVTTIPAGQPAALAPGDKPADAGIVGLPGGSTQIIRGADSASWQNLHAPDQFLWP